MKKLISLFVFLAISISGIAQTVDNFEVGPYEVDYKGSGDYKFRLRKGVNLYKYYGLKKDTIVVKKDTLIRCNHVDAPLSTPLKKYSWQVGFELSRRLWGFGKEATQAIVFGQYKFNPARNLFLNAGLSFGYQVNKCFANTVAGYNGIDAKIIEIGAPLSVEYSKLDSQRFSAFVLFGLTPIFSTTVSQKENDNDLGNSKGFRIDPRIEFGAYIPFGSVVGRLGVFIQKGLSLTESNPTGKSLEYGSRTSRVSIGGNISIVF